MFRLEHDVETSASDYEYHNNLLKEQLPAFLEMCNRAVTPLFYSLYYMQCVLANRLNIYYLSMEKLRAYAQDKFDLSNNVLSSYEHVFASRVADVTERMNDLSICKPLPPSVRVLQMARSGQPLTTFTPNSKADEAALPPAAHRQPRRRRELRRVPLHRRMSRPRLMSWSRSTTTPRRLRAICRSALATGSRLSSARRAGRTGGLVS